MFLGLMQDLGPIATAVGRRLDTPDT